MADISIVNLMITDTYLIIVVVVTKLTFQLERIILILQVDLQ